MYVCHKPAIIHILIGVLGVTLMVMVVMTMILLRSIISERNV